MGKSFHSQLREALDKPHTGEGRLSTREHYALKRAMREANMRGHQFQDAEELARWMTGGRRYA